MWGGCLEGGRGTAGPATAAEGLRERKIPLGKKFCGIRLKLTRQLCTGSTLRDTRDDWTAAARRRPDRDGAGRGESGRPTQRVRSRERPDCVHPHTSAAGAARRACRGVGARRMVSDTAESLARDAPSHRLSGDRHQHSGIGSGLRWSRCWLSQGTRRTYQSLPYPHPCDHRIWYIGRAHDSVRPSTSCVQSSFATTAGVIP